MRPLLALASLALVLLLISCNGESASEPTPLPNDTEPPPATATLEPEATATVVTPDIVPSTEIQLPEGFTAYRIGQDFFRPTSVALAPDGTIYVALRHDGIVQLRDNDGDGVFEQNIAFLPASNSAGEYKEFTGVLVSDENRVYISDRGRVTVAEDVDGDGVADSITPIITGLPMGRHQIDGLEFGPDGLLYITNGSTCDECDEEDERSATILQMGADGSNLRIFASGLRNPYDLVFDAEGRLWATDNGSDTPCETIDELDLIVDGGDYGWPYADDGCDPLADGIPPVASLGLHTAATGIDSYQADQFPPDYRGDLFITLWGSFVAEPGLAPQLLRATIGDTQDGPQVAIETFAEGFRHPIDVLVDRDGTLLVLDYGEGGADDRDGTLYRIIYTG